MTKAEARKFYRNQRKNLTHTEVNDLSKLIFDQIQSLDLSEIEVIHLFLPIEKNNEINTLPIINWLFEQKKRIVVPIVDGENLLNAEIKENFRTELRAFDIPEPIDYQLINTKAIDFIFTPLFVADKKGNRVGYGGGFYDRFFRHTKPAAIKCGLSFFDSIDEIEDVYLGDVPLDLMLSPTEILSFTTKSSKVLK